MPTIVQSVGVSSRLKGKLASFPRHQKTSSPTPAPAASIATRGFPCSCKSLFKDWITSSFRPCNDSFFTVATTVPMTRANCIFQLWRYSNRINHSDNGCVDRRVFHPCRQSRAGARNYEYAFMKTGADGIHRHHITGCIGAVNIDRTHDEQLL